MTQNYILKKNINDNEIKRVKLKIVLNREKRNKENKNFVK